MADVRANPGVPVLAQFGGLGAPSVCAPIVVNSATGWIYTLTSGDVVVAAGMGGTVTSVAQSFTGGLVSVAGSPITTSGTLALTVAGTSGGIPYFSSASTWASSAALAQHGVVVGGGAGVTPSTITAGTNNQFLRGNTGAAPSFGTAVLASADFANQGTTTTVLKGNAAGNPSFGQVVLTTDVSGVLPTANGGTNGNFTFAAGNYSPTLTAVANVAASTAYSCQYLRVGSTVTVSGRVDIDPTSATTETVLGISLPVASNFGASEDCGGVAWAPDPSNGAAILADAANNRAQLQYFTTADIANRGFWFTFSYEVI